MKKIMLVCALLYQSAAFAAGIPANLSHGYSAYSVYGAKYGNTTRPQKVRQITQTPAPANPNIQKMRNQLSQNSFTTPFVQETVIPRNYTYVYGGNSSNNSNSGYNNSSSQVCHGMTYYDRSGNVSGCN